MPAVTRARVAHLRSPIPQPFDLAQACALAHNEKRRLICIRRRYLMKFNERHENG
jgi:hypothetical protein